MTAVVRAASEADLPDIVAIYNHAIEHTTATFDTVPYTVDARRPWLAQFGDAHPLLVAVTGRVLGFAYYLPYRERPAYARTKEVTVYVAEDAAGRGVGSALYDALIRHARDHEVHALIAVLAGHNPASVALHQKHGFQRIGRLPEVGHKHGRYIDTELWHRLV